VTVNTSTIAIFPDKEFAQTDQRISFDQPGHRLTGTGLKAYFDTQAMELLSNVRSEHVARAP
jgi:lipopolysaccharide export system protein LptC